MEIYFLFCLKNNHTKNIKQSRKFAELGFHFADLAINEIHNMTGMYFLLS